VLNLIALLSIGPLQYITALILIEMAVSMYKTRLTGEDAHYYIFKSLTVFNSKC